MALQVKYIIDHTENIIRFWTLLCFRVFSSSMPCWCFFAFLLKILPASLICKLKVAPVRERHILKAPGSWRHKHAVWTSTRDGDEWFAWRLCLSLYSSNRRLGGPQSWYGPFIFFYGLSTRFRTMASPITFHQPFRRLPFTYLEQNLRHPSQQRRSVIGHCWLFQRPSSCEGSITFWGVWTHVVLNTPRPYRESNHGSSDIQQVLNAFLSCVWCSVEVVHKSQVPDRQGDDILDGGRPIFMRLLRRTRLVSLFWRLESWADS
jgi:hypothetical protein